MCFAIQTAGKLQNWYFGQSFRDDSSFGQLTQLMKGAMAELFMQAHEQSLVGFQQWLFGVSGGTMCGTIVESMTTPSDCE